MIIEKTIKRQVALQYILLLLSKLAMEYAYIKVLTIDKVTYPLAVNVIKYIYGIICLSIIFFLIPHGEKRPSTFLMYFFIVLNIIPMTIIYALQDESTIYYTCICIGIMLCEVLVRKIKPIYIDIKIRYIDKIFVALFIFLLVFFLLYVYRHNGLPSLIALNLYDVYELRSSGAYQLSKYMRYIQSLLTSVIIPILLAVFMTKKKYVISAIIYVIEIILYLYEGQKSFLFMGIMVILIVGWASRKKFEKEFWPMFMGGVAIVSFGADKKIIYNLYMLFIRRILIVSANNKYKYFDFFSSHPKEGWARIFPRWMVPIDSNYGLGYPDGYTYQIAKIYYNEPLMDCNTGFLAEGYMRWGFIGLFISMVILALVLKMVDGMAQKTSYQLALGCSVVTIFGLSDGYLISNILLGNLTVWILFILLYKEKDKDKLCVESQE